MAILTLKQLQSELGYDGVFEEYEHISHEGHNFDYCRLIVRSERRDSPNVTFLMDEKCTDIEYFSIGSWNDELFFGYHEIKDAICLAKKFVHQEICVTNSELTYPDELPLSLQKNETILHRCFFGKDAIVEPVDFSKYVFDEKFQMFLEKDFCSQLGIETFWTLGEEMEWRINRYFRT